VNDGKAHYVLERIHKLMEAYPDRPVSCLGVTFKANVDDLRESPALAIVESLAAVYGDRIGVVEPFIERLPESLRQFGVRRQQLEEALAEGGILVLLVDHDVFRAVDESRRIGAIIYDTRGVLGRKHARRRPVRRPRSAAGARIGEPGLDGGFNKLTRDGYAVSCSYA
jgi:UDP-N-acetyl-D-mannosaminuronic acid dehydrogenase